MHFVKSEIHNDTIATFHFVNYETKQNHKIIVCMSNKYYWVEKLGGILACHNEILEKTIFIPYMSTFEETIKGIGKIK